MGVERLERKDAQPFYNVIVEDGSHRSEDNSIKKTVKRVIQAHFRVVYINKFCFYHMVQHNFLYEDPDLVLSK